MQHTFKSYSADDLLAAHRSQHRTPAQIDEIEREIHRRLTLNAAVAELALEREDAELADEERRYRGIAR